MDFVIELKLYFDEGVTKIQKGNYGNNNLIF
jgi:hypothetical protein